MATIFKEWTFAEMMQLVAQTISLQCIPPFSREWLLWECGAKYKQFDLILILSDSKSEIITTFNLVWDKLINRSIKSMVNCDLRLCMCVSLWFGPFLGLSVYEHVSLPSHDSVSVCLRVCDCI